MASSNDQVFDDQMLLRYLLGTLPQEDAERVDELSIADENLAGRLDALENDLVDAYVRGELAGEDLAQFKNRYLSSPRGRNKVEFAETFLAFQERSVQPTRDAAARVVAAEARGAFSRLFLFSQWGFAAAAAVLFAVAAYLFTANQRLQKEFTALQAQQNAVEERRHDLEKQLAQQRSAEAGQAKQERNLHPDLSQLSTMSVLLSPPRRGAAALPVISIPKGIDLVQLLLELDSSEYSSYEAALTSARTSQVLWQSGRLKSTALGERKAVTVSLPASRLHQQDYLLELSGKTGGRRDTIASYPFRVVLK